MILIHHGFVLNILTDTIKEDVITDENCVIEWDKFRDTITEKMNKLIDDGTVLDFELIPDELIPECSQVSYNALNVQHVDNEYYTYAISISSLKEEAI